MTESSWVVAELFTAIGARATRTTAVADVAVAALAVAALAVADFAVADFDRTTSTADVLIHPRTAL